VSDKVVQVRYSGRATVGSPERARLRDRDAGVSDLIWDALGVLPQSRTVPAIPRMPRWGRRAIFAGALLCFRAQPTCRQSLHQDSKALTNGALGGESADLTANSHHVRHCMDAPD